MRTLIAAAMLLACASFSAADGDWDPVSTPGLGTVSNIALTGLMEFDGFLYIATENPSIGARIYRTDDGNTFTAVMTGGFGDGVTKITEFRIFGGYLYCGTASPAGGSVYRSLDGLTWTLASPIGFGSAMNVEVGALEVFGSDIWAGTKNTSGAGSQLWKSPDGTTWTSVNTTGFGDPDNTAINDLVNSSSFLYAGTTNIANGGNLVRVASGGGFAILVPDGFGSVRNTEISALEIYNGQLFMGTRNTGDGYEIWSSPDDLAFFLRVSEGFGDDGNVAVTDLAPFGSAMYVGTESPSEPFEVIRTFSGASYNQEDADGFGDPGNFRANRFATFGNQVWMGTSNPSGGGLYHTDIVYGAEVSGSVDFGGGGGHGGRHHIHCFVATAAFGSPAAPRVAELRRIRDQRIEGCEAGRRFTDLYRCTAPAVAGVVQNSEVMRAILRRALLR